RYDMMCSAVWQSGQRAKIALLSHPAYFDALYAFARNDDHRFDRGLEQINASGIKIAVIDNDITQSVRQMRFPNAGELALSPLSDSSQILMSVATGKADVALLTLDSIKKFNKVSDKKLKLIADGHPVRLFAGVFAMKRGENDLKNMIDSTVQSLEVSGEVDAIVTKYAVSGFVAPAPIYTRPEVRN
ncbi:MAG: transporter substrate-binding domain-containing protein, partial [Pseudomonadota bacterium]